MESVAIYPTNAGFQLSQKTTLSNSLISSRERAKSESPILKTIREFLEITSDLPMRLLASIDSIGSHSKSLYMITKYIDRNDWIAVYSVYRRNQTTLKKDEKFISELSKILVKLSEKADYKRLRQVLRVFGVGQEVRVSALMQVLSEREFNSNFKQFQRDLQISDSILVAAVPYAALDALGKLDIGRLNNLKENAARINVKTINSSPEVFFPGLIEASLRSGTPCSTYAAIVGISKEKIDAGRPVMLPMWQTAMMNNFALKTFLDIDSFVDSKREYAAFIAEKKITPKLGLKEMPLVHQLKISMIEAEELLQKGFNLSSFVTGDKSKELVDALEEFSSIWADKQHVSAPFRVGAEIFGFDKMMHYSYKPGHRRHDTLFAFNRIVQVYLISTLSADTFFEKILRQVHRDDGTYAGGSSFHMLNNLVEQLDLNLSATLDLARQTESIPEIQKLTEFFTDVGSIFSSWRNLKKFSELSKLVKDRELLIELESLRREGREDLYNFLTKLAFRPESQVRIETVLQFWKDPKNFLETEGVSSVSPAHYCTMPHLDLSPRKLRDGLVNGAMDTFQAIPSFEIRYQIPRMNAGTSTRALLSSALGSSKQKIVGLANDSKKLFSVAQNILKKHRITVQEYLAGSVIPPELETDVFEAIFTKPFGIQEEFVEVIVKINNKSDPDGLIAGNDTASCMPFGSEKNSVYMFSPNCSLLTVQMVLPSGSLKTIAQSVVTLDGDLKTPAMDARQLLGINSRTSQLLGSENFRLRQLPILACDNIEIAPNYRDPKSSGIISAAYQEFFREYLSEFDEKLIDKSKVIVGTGYTETLRDATRLRNTYIPLSPISYSDNLSESCIAIMFGISRATVRGESSPSKVRQKSKSALIGRTIESGIAPLTYLDTFAMAAIEYRRYDGTLGEPFAELANTLSAKDISNGLHDRPELSFIYYNEQGLADGYLLAYEGRYGSGENGHVLDSTLLNSPVIYIADFAAMEGKSVVPLELLSEFMKTYKSCYLDKGEAPRIVAEFKEESSYRLLPALLRRYSKIFGLEFEINEYSSIKEKTTTLYPLIIKPKLKD